MMSSWLEHEVRGLLQQTGRLDKAVMGPADRHAPPDPDVAKRFAERLNQSWRLRDGIIVAVAVLYLVLFAMGIVMIVQYRDDTIKAAAFFGGDLAALALVALWMRRVWMDKAVVDIFSALADGLPSDDVLKFLQILYYGRGEGGSGGVIGRRSRSVEDVE